MDILSNETYKQYKNLSRYTLVPIFYNKVDKKYQPGFPMQLNKDIVHIEHKVLPGDTLDNLSLYYYGNPTYYWIIADYNNILDPFKELVVDDKLKIPTFSEITFNEV